MNVYSATHGVKIERPDSKHAVVTTRRKISCRPKTSACSSTTATSRVGRQRRQLSAQGERSRLLPAARQPGNQSGRRETVPKTVSVRRRSLGQHERRENRAGPRRAEVRAQQPARRRHVQHRRLRQRDPNFRPELEKFNDETRAAAIGFVDGLYAGGSTNIDGALKRALGMLTDSSRPNYVLFLTDGLPTTGETGEAAIVKHARKSTTCGPACSPSASVTTSTAGCSIGWPARTSASANTCGRKKTSKRRSARSIARSARR